MWDQVGKALNASMVRVLSQFASLLPGILALVVALLISAGVAWVLAAIVRRSLVSIDFDRKLPGWGFPSVSDWSPANSPTRLVTRSLVAIVMIVGFLIGVSAFDVTVTTQMVVR